MTANPQTPASPADVHVDPHAADHEHESHVHTFFDEDQYPAAHFQDPEQQKESAALGMWAFLATEVLLFSGLFLVYTIYRGAYPEGFIAGSHYMSVPLGTINTLVLLLSSMFVVLAVHSARTNSSKGVFWYLVGTIVLGCVFFVIKGFEYYHDYEIGLIPWISWDSTRLGENNYQIRLFMILYFVMTGTHAVHMIVGMLILAYIAYRGRQGAYNAEYHTPLEMSGLYWHFVDIVWVFLVPTLYLIDLYVDVPLTGV